MIEAIIIIFIIGYAAIALEHPIKINKTASALLTAGLIWTLYTVYRANFPSSDGHGVTGDLQHHLGEISEILFFLLGAMTIVELVDAHQGFKVITNRITTKNRKKLLWLISCITFVLSAVLDNLTTSIVMVSLLRRLIHDDEDRKFFAGMVIIAANAGGAWSPIGDVTTTMLWAKGQIDTGTIIIDTLLPSIACLLVPLVLISLRMKGEVTRNAYDHEAAYAQENVRGSKLMLYLGVGGLLFVPFFKSITHLPPYVGMLISLAVIWIASEIIHADRDEEEKKPYTAVHALTKIDTSSILFFLGILLAVGGLQSLGLLTQLAETLDKTFGNLYILGSLIGLASAIIDNVPLVAAAQGMYWPDVPLNDEFWTFLAYTAGTGGSALIIGSAAGVTVMGMEKISFFWYLKRVSIWALIGFAAGVGVFMLQKIFF